LKSWNEGRPIETPEEPLDGLLPYVDGPRESGNAVSTAIVTAELLRRSPQLLQVGFVLLCCRAFISCRSTTTLFV